MKFNVAFIGALGILIMAGLGAGQGCDPATKVAFARPVTLDDITPFLELQDQTPESCEGFELVDLLVCQGDVNIEEGCCDPGCEDFMQKVTAECLKDLTDLGCAAGAGEFIPVLDNLVRRCHDNYSPLACSKDVEVSTPECSPDVVEAEEKANLTTLTPLASLDPPASCGDFKLTALLTCINELNVIEGCCQEACRNVFEPVSQQCLIDTYNVICKSESSDAMPIVRRVASRCHSDPIDLTCEEAAELAAVEGPDVEEDIPTILEGEVDDIPDASEASSSPMTFFGPRDDAPSPPTRTFFGSSSDEEDKCDAEIDPNADIQAIASLLTDVSPEACPELNSTAIFKCQKDVSTKENGEGCCEDECKEFLKSLSEGCRQEVLQTACLKNADIFHIIQRTASKCLPNFESIQCSDVKNGGRQSSTIPLAALGGALLVALLFI